MLVGRYIPTKVIRVHNKEKPWFDDQCRLDFSLMQEAHLRWTRDRSPVCPLSLSFGQTHTFVFCPLSLSVDLSLSSESL